jgi:hypothetical protein
MTDLPSSLGIEAVECVAEGGRNLTVRVTGRWRRRRPELRGQAMLVVETEAGRQRFLAMPEPPSLIGAAPGTWRMSFSVPAELAPALPGRTFLQLGGVMVPLPIGEVTIAAERGEAPSPDVLEARRARGSELAAESARRRAAELATEVERLEGELGEARGQSDRLQEELAARERRTRSAEQHAHAERALRAELEQELTRRGRAAQHELRALHDRVAELERELVRLRRAVDEAGHLAAAADAARAAAERQLAERPPPAATAHPPPPRPPAVDAARAALVRRELELDRSARTARPSLSSARPVANAADRALLELETGMARNRGERADSGLAELERADSRVAELERELAAAREDAVAQHARSARAYEAIELVRGELRQLRASAPTDPPTPSPAAAPSPPPSPPAASGPIQAEQLSEALARLRERTPPVDLGPAARAPAPVDRPEPARAVKPWLHSSFRRLAAEDASAAGRLVVALLPAQRAADPQPVAYDLILSDVLVAHVTSDSLAVHVEHDATARPASEVDFQLVGDLASLARLLRAGRIRRRLRVPPRRIARVRGDRRRLAALDRLLDVRLTVRELGVAGVRLDPVLALTVAGLMIEPAWTTGERFVIGHRESAAAGPRWPRPSRPTARWRPCWTATPMRSSGRSPAPPVARWWATRSRWRSCGSGSIAHKAAKNGARAPSIRAGTYARITD